MAELGLKSRQLDPEPMLPTTRLYNHRKSADQEKAGQVEEWGAVGRIKGGPLPCFQLAGSQGFVGPR